MEAEGETEKDGLGVHKRERWGRPDPTSFHSTLVSLAPLPTSFMPAA